MNFREAETKTSMAFATYTKYLKLKELKVCIEGILSQLFVLHFFTLFTFHCTNLQNVILKIITAIRKVLSHFTLFRLVSQASPATSSQIPFGSLELECKQKYLGLHANKIITKNTLPICSNAWYKYNNARE